MSLCLRLRSFSLSSPFTIAPFYASLDVAFLLKNLCKNYNAGAETPAAEPSDEIELRPADPATDDPSAPPPDAEPASLPPPRTLSRSKLNFDDDLERMRSGLFLVCYTVTNALMLSMCAVYIILTRDLDVESDNALVLPLIVAVIPGRWKKTWVNRELGRLLCNAIKRISALK